MIIVIIYPGDSNNLGKVELFGLWVVLLHSGLWGHWFAESWEGWTVIKGPEQFWDQLQSWWWKLKHAGGPRLCQARSSSSGRSWSPAVSSPMLCLWANRLWSSEPFLCSFIQAQNERGLRSNHSSSFRKRVAMVLDWKFEVSRKAGSLRRGWVRGEIQSLTGLPLHCRSPGTEKEKLRSQRKLSWNLTRSCTSYVTKKR